MSRCVTKQNRDENLTIVNGDAGLATACAVHLPDVHDHYRFRATAEQK